MLVKLLPDQVSRNWDTIGYAIENSLPPIVDESDERMNNILLALLDGRMDCWVSLNGDGKINGVVSTTIMYDDLSGVRSLLIYSIFAFEWSEEEAWSEGLETLRKYAKGNDCSRITGYTEFDSIIQRVKDMGGEAKQMFISLPLSSM